MQRSGYVIRRYRLTAQGACPNCGRVIPGIWTDRSGTVNIDNLGLPRLVIR